MCPKFVYQYQNFGLAPESGEIYYCVIYVKLFLTECAP